MGRTGSAPPTAEWPRSVVSRLAALAVAAVLVLAGCGAPDYGGHDSDANTWPKSDASPTSKPSNSKASQGRPTRSESTPEPSTKPQRSRLPETLAGEPLEPRSRAIDDVMTEIVGTTPGLAWDGGLYVREGRPFGLGLFVFTGRPEAIDELDRTFRVGSVSSVGRSACATYQGPNPARVCWRSASRRLVLVIGVGQSSDERLARAVDEAWTYVTRKA